MSAPTLTEVFFTAAGFHKPDWPEVDFATLCAGAVLVPIYPTLLPDQVTSIAQNCGAKVEVGRMGEGQG